MAAGAAGGGTFALADMSFVESDTLTPTGGSLETLSISPDQTKLYALNLDTDWYYAQFGLSTAGDITTNSHTARYDLSAQVTLGTGAEVSRDGSTAIVLNIDETLKEYSLSTDYSIASASYVSSVDLSAKVASAKGVTFATDSLSFVAVDLTGDRVEHYAISPANDTSTASWQGTYKIGQAGTGPTTLDTPRGVCYNKDGTVMLAWGSDGSNLTTIFEFTLSTPNDPDTLTHTTTKDVSGDGVGIIRGVAISDENEMYVLDINLDIHKYA